MPISGIGSKQSGIPVTSPRWIKRFPRRRSSRSDRGRKIGIVIQRRPVTPRRSSQRSKKKVPLFLGRFAILIGRSFCIGNAFLPRAPPPLKTVTSGKLEHRGTLASASKLEQRRATSMQNRLERSSSPDVLLPESHTRDTRLSVSTVLERDFQNDCNRRASLSKRSGPGSSKITASGPVSRKVGPRGPDP